MAHPDPEQCPALKGKGLSSREETREPQTRVTARQTPLFTGPCHLHDAGSAAFWKKPASEE